MILGAITGEGFCLSADRAFRTLKGRFSTLFVVSGVTRTVVFGYAGIISFCVYLATMTIVCAAMPSCSPIGSKGGMLPEIVTTIGLLLVGMIATSYAIPTILTILLLAGIIAGQGYDDVLLGMFTGALSCYLLTFFGEVILDVTNSLFALAEIDRKNGKVPVAGAKEGTPAHFADYYYTEMNAVEAANPSLQAGGDTESVAVASGQTQVMMGTVVQ